MTKHSRRRFLAGTAVLPFSGLLSRLVEAQAGYTVRSEWSTPQGQTNLKKYAAAVGIMKKTSASSAANPVSWNFQWYTHATPSSKAVLIAQTYPTCTPPAWCNLAKAAWSTCQAHGLPVTEEWYFLPWHRMYVYYLEAVVRGVLKDNTFSLPYWDYTKRSVLPEPFRSPTDPTWGPLFNNRGTGINNKPVNDGDPIDTTQYLTGLMNEALCEGGYTIQGQVQGFCANLDWNLHGTVHGAIGGSMGSVPTAAVDPIFWLHHCNIDRLWASWNQNGGANPPDGNFLAKTFTFADGTGTSVSPAVKGFLDTKALKYGYDRLEKKPAACLTGGPITNLTAAQPTVTDRAPGPVTLGTQPVRVTLQPPPGGAAPVNITERVKALPEAARLSIILRNISSEVHPNVIYNVFLNLPASAAPQAESASRIGQLSFFDLVPHEGHAPQVGRFFRFDITTSVKALAAKNALGDGLSLTIAPRGEAAANAKPVIGEIVVVRH